MEHGEQISIPGRDIGEPVLCHGRDGRQTVAHPGNKEFTADEYIVRPSSGGGGRGGDKASNSSRGMDDFVFQITQEELPDFMSKDPELPNLVKRYITGTDILKTVRTGISNDGNPSCIDIARTPCSVHARRTALSGGSRAKLRAALKELERVKREEPDNLGDIQELELEVARLRARIDRVPFPGTLDLKYSLLAKQPNPTSKAAMFCLMDVFGSMTQATKDIARRFFILLYLSPKRNYKRVEVVFIRHYTGARKVDEGEFFYSRETGGTIVSSALKMMQEVMAECHSTHKWNIYATQALDGGNWNDDSPVCRDILLKQIMSFVQYYIYVEITPRERQALWFEYERVREVFEGSFAQQWVVSASDIYPVFRKLFQRRLAA